MKVIILLLLVLIVSCAQAVQPVPTAKPQMAYFWTGEPSRPPSSQQFAKDKYACTQDYRMTQPTIPTQRDVVTEINLMDLHLETCLASKGWELRPIGEKNPRPLPPHDGPWNQYANNAEAKTTQTSMLDQAAWETLEKALPKLLHWEGHPDREPSLQQFKAYLRACDEKFIALHGSAKPIPSDNQKWPEYIDACMKTNGYGKASLKR